MKPKSVLLLGLNGSIDIVNGIAGFAKENKWNLMIEEASTLSRIPHCDGVLVTLLNLKDRLRITRQAVRAGIPVLDLNDEIRMKGVSRVTVDFAAAGALAAQHFTERGFCRAAWFSIDNYRMHTLVKTGFETIWQGERLLNWTRGIRNGARAFDSWLEATLRSAQLPIAVLTFNTYNALRLLNFCLSAGIDVPNEVAILSATNETPFLDSTQTKTISYVDFDYESLGREAARTLEQAMSGLSGETVRLPPNRICLGNSTDIFTVDDPLIRKAILYIHDHLNRPINASDIAAHVGVSRATLDRQFLSTTGHTTGKEILRQRMASVRDLLISTDMKLEAIAASVGMCHASYLIKVFTREHRMSPTDFRMATCRNASESRKGKVATR